MMLLCVAKMWEFQREIEGVYLYKTVRYGEKILGKAGASQLGGRLFRIFS